MSTDPTAEHIDAVACVIGYGDVPAHRTRARTLLTTASADAHAALAASLPAEVMLAALVDRGNDAELARRLEWATGLIGATLLVAIRSEGLEVVRVKPEQVAP